MVLSQVGWGLGWLTHRWTSGWGGSLKGWLEVEGGSLKAELGGGGVGGFIPVAKR